VKRALVLLALATTACPKPTFQRAYPAPKPAALLAHIATLRERATSLNAETKTDFRLGKDRVNLKTYLLAAWGGKLRFQAMQPNDSLAVDLASDGEKYCFLDSMNNCGECGTSSPENIARLVHIPLAGDDIVGVLMGGTPVLDTDDVTLAWDTAEGQEVVTLTRGNEKQVIRLDGRDHHWDVLSSEYTDGKYKWRIQHKDFREVKTATGSVARMPGRSLFEDSNDTVRIIWNDHRVGEELDAGKFQLDLQQGLPQCK
jgi:hypothetical protein